MQFKMHFSKPWSRDDNAFLLKMIDPDKRYGKMEEKFKGTQGWRNKSNQIFQKKYVKNNIVRLSRK